MMRGVGTIWNKLALSLVAFCDRAGSRTSQKEKANAKATRSDDHQNTDNEASGADTFLLSLGNAKVHSALGDSLEDDVGVR